METMIFKYIYIGITAVVAVYFLYSYLKRKETYEILLTIWIPISWLPLLISNSTFRNIMIAVQVILFVIFIFFLFRPDKKRLVKTQFTPRVVPAEGIIDDIETGEEPDSGDEETGDEDSDK